MLYFFSLSCREDKAPLHNSSSLVVYWNIHPTVQLLETSREKKNPPTPSLPIPASYNQGKVNFLVMQSFER